MPSQVQQLVYHAPRRTVFSILADDEKLIQQLKKHFGKLLWNGSTSLPCKYISVLREAGQYRVSFEGERFVSADPLQTVISIMFDHVQYDPSVLALHGAAVEWQGRAYLFLAHTNGGKTTLSAYLSACGFGYITDDCILLDRENFGVYPDQKPIHLRLGGLNVLRKLGLDPNCEMFFIPPNERYVYTPASAVTESTTLGEIFFIQRTDNENCVEVLSKNQRLEMLMKSPIKPYPVNGEYLRLLMRLADYGCRVLHYCDMGFVKDTVKKSLFQNSKEL